MAFLPIASAQFPAVAGILAALAGASLVAGCEKRVDSANIEAANKLQESAQQRKSRWPGIAEGLTEKEVESILGQPAERRAGATVRVNQPVDLPTVTYVYKQDGQEIELSFLDGKLQGKVPKFGEKVESKAPLTMEKPKLQAAQVAAGALAGEVAPAQQTKENK